MESLISQEIATPIGQLFAVSSEAGLCLLDFTEVEERLIRHKSQLKKTFRCEILQGQSPILRKLNKQLDEYFDRKRKTFDLPLIYKGTEFQEKAWHALSEIPYGETRSYRDQAIAIQQPKAIRAVANANNRNKLAIVIPCHRVIGSDGSMTGYGGELWRKEYLLSLENAI